MESGLKILAMISTYLEGPIADGAIRSALGVDFDAVVVFEGRAGDALRTKPPETDFLKYAGRIDFHEGKWVTDAAKRTAMVKYVQSHYWPTDDVSLWGLWIDGDEVLMNGEWLRDKLQYLEWRGAIENEPYIGAPIRIIEMGGTSAWALARCIRLDQVDKYLASNSYIRFKNGEERGRGHVPESAFAWWEPRGKMVAEDLMFLMPPFDRPLDPYLVHRSAWRHPLRVGLRMHEQEAQELKRLGVL